VPGLTADARRDPPDLARAETVDKGHGRIETRRIAVRTKLPARLDEKWPAIKAICRIERIRELKTYCSREVIYAITSAPPEAFDAAALLQASRDHWAIENREFHVRDVTFREDASRIRTGDAPEVMTALRSSALALIRRTGQKPTAARPAYAARPKTAIRLLMRS
jgi:hypothetical protein